MRGWGLVRGCGVYLYSISIALHSSSSKQSHFLLKLAYERPEASVLLLLLLMMMMMMMMATKTTMMMA